MKKTVTWDTRREAQTIRALQEENRAMQAALIDCNIQAAGNADQCDDCEWVMRRAGKAASIREVVQPKRKKAKR